MSARKKFACLDCGKDTGRLGEHYYVHDEVWLSVVADKTGMLCVGCLEKRLGRQLTAGDFPDVFINSPKFGLKSERLLDRLKA